MQRMTLRRATILAVVAALALVGVVGSSQSAEAGSATIYIDEDFQGADWDDDPKWWNWIGGYLASSPVPGIEGDGTRITMKPGRHDAAMLDYQFELNGHSAPDEAYFRYWMRFEALPEDTGKLPGFMALYSDSARGQVKPSQSKPGWSARVLFGPGDAGQNVKLGYYLYWLGQSQSYGDGLWWSKQVPLGQWVCVEGHVAMNTPGADDGRLTAWLDGDRVFDRADIRYRTGTQSFVHVRDFMFEVYYGGSSTPSSNVPVSFDSLVVSDERVGCGTPAPSGSFEDTDGSPFVSDIEWLAATGVTKGCNPPANTRFCPKDVVTRGQMAAFLHRALDDLLTVSAPPPPPPSPPPFWGVEAASPYDSLDAMAAAGAPIDVVHLEYALSGGDWSAVGQHSDRSYWVPLQLDRITDEGAVPWIEFYDTNISGFANGSYDAEWNGWLDTVTGWLDQDPTNRLIIVPFPDANNKNLAYGDSASAFRSAYTKVHNDVRARGIGDDQVLFVYQMSGELNSNRYSKASAGSGYGTYAPNREHVDLASVSWLNDGVPTWDDWDSMFAARVNEMAGALGGDVPVVLGIIGSAPSSSGESRSEWFAGLADGIRSSRNAVGFVYLDKDRSVAYGVDTHATPDAGLTSAVVTLSGPNDRLSWYYTQLNDWVAAMRASSSAGLFSDDDGSTFEADIAWLARSGITKGCGQGKFCPSDVVTRGQMAAFLRRALDGLLPVSSPPGSFVDVAGSSFASDIAWLSAAGITKGCNPPANDRFCPDASVTRGQMAAFLHRALKDLVGS